MGWLEEETERQQKYKKYLDSLPVWTLEEFYQYQKDNNVSLEMSDKLYDDIEDLCEDCFYDVADEEDTINAINSSKKIPVETLKKFQLSVGWLKDRIIDYGNDNFAMSYYDTEPECMEYVDEFVEKFNSAQTWYVSDTQIAWVDASREVEEWLSENED